MSEAQNELIRRLDTLLDIERTALLEGDLEKLASIVDEKEELIDALNKGEVDEADGIQPVTEKVERNQLLLEQALAGIRTVAKRLADLREVRKAFETYDESGTRNRIEPETPSSVERRA